MPTTDPEVHQTARATESALKDAVKRIEGPPVKLDCSVGRPGAIHAVEPTRATTPDGLREAVWDDLQVPKRRMDRFTVYLLLLTAQDHTPYPDSQPEEFIVQGVEVSCDGPGSLLAGVIRGLDIDIRTAEEVAPGH
ncbi:unnamed protein product [Rhizoctonia solani]|uniref:Uncharacterized protein n=1 Tax=Rhizoctonia solani TaxID=456999 RepID=A0A8H3C068_9AGAM|nr:unnamed protein product [Rhizoctonia solani]